MLNQIQKRTLDAMPLNEPLRRKDIKITTLHHRMPPVTTLVALETRGFVELVERNIFSEYNVYKKTTEATHA